MSQESNSVAVTHDEPKLKLSSYITGFILSLCLTLGAYLMVTHKAASHHLLLIVVIILALAQFVVQLIFFLHLGSESKPRWRLGVFGFMLGVVLIIVFGSLWIIYNLNTRMSLPKELQYMNGQDQL